MRFTCTTQLKQNIRIGAAVAVLVAVVLALSYALYTREPELLEPNEQPGQPIALDESYGYSHVAPQGVPCVLRLCAAPRVEGKDVYLNLTSLEENVYLMRAEVYSVELMVNAATGEQSFEPGKLLGKTGFIHPGTYVEKLHLDKGLKNGENPVYIKIALREEDTGHSGGSFFLSTTFVK